MMRLVAGCAVLSMVVASPGMAADAGAAPLDVSVVPDLDGDGLPDLLGLWHDEPDVGLPSVRIEALRGATGAALWSVTEPGEPETGWARGGVFAAGPVGGSGDPGVLFGVEGDLPGALLTVSEDQRIISVGADGVELWRSEITHAEHLATGEVRSLRAAGDILPGPAIDAVVFRDDRREDDEPLDPDQADVFQLIDGRDGSIHASPIPRTALSVVVVPDLSGDGLHDLVWRRFENGTTVFEASEALGEQPLWTLSGFFGALSWEMGDIDGDSVEDGMITGFTQRALVSGATGTLLWITEDYVSALGDVDGDGIGDLLLWRPTKDASNVTTVRYRAVSGSADPIYEASYSVAPIDGGSFTSISASPVGDADGDGVVDVWQLLADGGASPAAGTGLVSGRTGELLWRAEDAGVGSSVTWIGPIDGVGVDLLEGNGTCDPTARSGADGSLLWRAADACGGVAEVADLSGDGSAEVILADASGTTTAVSGSDGSILWSI